MATSTIELTHPALRTYRSWLDSQTLQPRTRYLYLNDMVKFARWFAERKTFHPIAITAQDVQLFISHLEKQRLSGATINRQVAALESFCRCAMDRKVIKINPAAGIKRVTLQENAPQWLTSEQVEALLAAAHAQVQTVTAPAIKNERLREQRRLAAERDLAFVCLLLNSGLRVAEACHLTIGDVILENTPQVRVRQGKGRKDRRVPLNEQARRALGRWLALHPQVGQKGARLFIGKVTRSAHHQGTFGERSAQASLKKLSVLSGVSVTPHTLRHTFAKRLVDTGVSLDRVAKIMGHTSVETTRIYTEPSFEDLAQAVGRLA